MADYTYGKVIKTCHEWHIPGAGFGGFGTPIVEIQKAIDAAATIYESVTGCAPRHDDWLRAYAADDEIVLWFEEGQLY